ncbi:MAG: hypothetical protein ABIZ50_06565, partial [Solirubrobacterales bacterium]
MLALASIALGPLPEAQAAAATPAAAPRITIAMLPQGTEVQDLVEAVPRIAPGLLSAGLGDVASGQTYLDIGQGNRLSRSLYPKKLPPLYVTGNRVPARIWRQVRTRAAKAPADIVPGLLASTLGEEGVPVAARPFAGSAALIAADRSGRIPRVESCPSQGCPGLTVERVGIKDLDGLAADVDLDRSDLLIAIERPPTERDLLAIGIVGGGFEDGELTSATTRMDGYVLATDLLPTILDRYGIDAPTGITGRVIETTGGSVDPGALSDREDRLGQVRERRWGVLAVNLFIWCGLVAAGAAAGRRRWAAAGLSILAVTMALVPAILLLSAALAPSDLVERLMVGVGGPLLAAGMLLAMRSPLGGRGHYGAFALAAAISVGATAIDMVFGSPLTALSLLGPNPALGVRFFGIGNELEATIAVLLTLGCGAAITALRPADPARAMAIATVLVTVAAVVVFAPGRLGADVGAAITFPAGGAVAVIVALGLGRRRALLVLAAPLGALVLLVGIDLVTGGDAHLSRSVLGAGGLSDLGDVFQRRISQSARSFPRYIGSPFFIAALLGIIAGIFFRERVASWLSGLPAALAGVAGAIAATVVGTLANDS